MKRVCHTSWRRHQFEPHVLRFQNVNVATTIEAPLFAGRQAVMIEEPLQVHAQRQSTICSKITLNLESRSATMRTTLQTTHERFSGSSNNNYSSQQQQRKAHLDAEICCAGRLFPLSCTVRNCMRGMYICSQRPRVLQQSSLLCFDRTDRGGPSILFFCALHVTKGRGLPRDSLTPGPLIIATGVQFLGPKVLAEVVCIM